VTVIRVAAHSPLAPERILAAARDFSPRREKVFDAWERCDYDWSTPGCVKAPVKDSNVYDSKGSSWEITATASNGGSHVEMTWTRRFKHTPRGLLFGTMYRTVGKPIFSRYARDILAKMVETEEPA